MTLKPAYALALFLNLLLVARAMAEPAQLPLFLGISAPPLNLLVMGRDHKMFYEAYTTYGDYDGDGVVDNGYKGYKTKTVNGVTQTLVDYYGYFNSRLCYAYNDYSFRWNNVVTAGQRFEPTAVGTGPSGKECSNAWSGDLLNYLATSRMDALRKVLYGGYRTIDSTANSGGRVSETMLSAAYIPQDAHAWGSEYTSPTVDGYDISHFAPLAIPASGTRHLFAVTSFSAQATPKLRVFTNTRVRIWNWISIEAPDAANDWCFNTQNRADLCIPQTSQTSSTTSSGEVVPAAHLSDLRITTWVNPKTMTSLPTARAQMDDAIPADGPDFTFQNRAELVRRCGSLLMSVLGKSQINSSPSGNNPFSGNSKGVNIDGDTCNSQNYGTHISGKLTAPETGTYKFSIDGDDVVDATINGEYLGPFAAGSDRFQFSNSRSKSITLTAGQVVPIIFRHVQTTGDDNYGLYWKTPTQIAADSTASAAASAKPSMSGYDINVLVCPNDVVDATGAVTTSKTPFREANCVRYANKDYRPTGILHERGKNGAMLFGLLTGSYQRHYSGGVLRVNIQNFEREFNKQTGQFCLEGACAEYKAWLPQSEEEQKRTSNVNGIVDNINRIRIAGFDYGAHEYKKFFCTRYRDPITDPTYDQCYDWGTPTAEMMYESLRYFAGALAPTPLYDYDFNSNTPDDQLGLSKPTWVPPYLTTAQKGAGYSSCSVPSMTVISDINPNYDWKIPGGQSWNYPASNITLPAADTNLPNFNISTQTDQVGSDEGLNGQPVFIGEQVSGPAPARETIGMPTWKTIGQLSKIRGLSPEEPSKQGTYYSAGVARYAAKSKIGTKGIDSFIVALSSPYPRIEFPVNSTKVVTLVPFAKTIKSDSPDGFKATDQFADFYVEKLANTTPDNQDITINQGRPYASFRVNWEDGEAGELDMDAIVLYTLRTTDKGDLEVTLRTEYAMGSAKQHMGYSIAGSGKSTDGLYLEVCDLKDGTTNNGLQSSCDGDDGSGAGNSYYAYNTPSGRLPGYCVNNSAAECNALPPRATRLFKAPTGVPPSTVQGPLWYAAKYGTTAKNWDADGNGIPDNYSLITNPTKLNEQLRKNYQDTAARARMVSRPIAEREPTNEAAVTTQALYRSSYDTENWSGELTKEKVDLKGNKSVAWKASEHIPATRAIKFSGQNGLQDFTWGNLTGLSFAGTSLQNLLNRSASGTLDNYGEARVKVLRGESCIGDTGCMALNRMFPKLGDIINSGPVVVAAPTLSANIADRYNGNLGDYAKFQKAQEKRSAQLYIGANDGMLHGFDATSGTETFAFIPTAVMGKLSALTASDYLSNHQTYVDGALQKADVYYDGGWHTVLLGALGAGGREVFALDVTNPDSIKLLWEFTSDSAAGKTCTGNNCVSDLGYSLPAPTIARLHTGQWAAVIANGYDSASGKATLFLLDIRTGNLIKRLDAGDSDNSANGLSTPLPVDADGDGNTDYAYAGDLHGNLWRFDLLPGNGSLAKASTPSPTTATSFQVAFGGKPLYVARSAASNGVRQAITAPPLVTLHPSGTGLIVVFGTGKYYEITDPTNLALQSLYGIWDRQTNGQAATSTPLLSRADLQQQSISTQTITTNRNGQDIQLNVRLLSDNQMVWHDDAQNTGKWGWYLDLAVGNTLAGERMVDPMQQLDQVLLVATRTPSKNPCSSGVDGLYYGLNPSTGGRMGFNVFDLNGDGKVDDQDGNGISGIPSDDGVGGFIVTTNQPYDLPCLTGADGRCITLNKRSQPSGRNGRQSWTILPEMPAQAANGAQNAP